MPDRLRVRDHVTPTAFMRVRFIAADLGEESVVEAALDEFSVWDAESPIVEVPPVSAGAIRLAGPWPNPSAGVVTLALELPVAARVEATVYDVAGRRVRVALLGNDPVECLPLVELDSKGRLKICPARLEEALAGRIREVARASFRACGCRDYALVDVRVTDPGEVLVVGVETLGILAGGGSFALALRRAGFAGRMRGGGDPRAARGITWPWTRPWSPSPLRPWPGRWPARTGPWPARRWLRWS